MDSMATRGNWLGSVMGSTLACIRHEGLRKGIKTIVHVAAEPL